MASFGLAAGFGTRISAPRVTPPRRIPGTLYRLRRRSFAVVAAAAKVDKDSVFERTKEVIEKQLEVKDVNKDTSFSDLTSDSLDIVELMMALEEEFEVNFEDDDSVTVTNVQEAVDMIAETIEKGADKTKAK